MECKLSETMSLNISIRIMDNTEQGDLWKQKITKSFSKITHRQNSEHHLRNVKRMPPIMVCYIAVVLLDAQQPPT